MYGKTDWRKERMKQVNLCFEIFNLGYLNINTFTVKAAFKSPTHQSISRGYVLNVMPRFHTIERVILFTMAEWWIVKQVST